LNLDIKTASGNGLSSDIPVDDGYLETDKRREEPREKRNEDICDPWTEVSDLDKVLPPDDCFNGTGLGIWNDPFTQGFNLHQATNVAWRQQETFQWYALGARYVHLGAQYDDYPAREAWTWQNVSLDSEPGGYLTVNPSSFITDYIYEPDSQSWIVSGLREAILRQTLPNPPDGRLRITVDCIHIDEPDNKVLAGNVIDEGLWAVFKNNLNTVFQYLRGNNPKVRSAPCTMAVSITSYSEVVIQRLIKEFAPEIRSGCLKILPDIYNTVNAEDRWVMYEDIKRMAGKAGLRPVNFRPMLAPNCDFCVSYSKDDPNHQPASCCNPEWLIADMIHARALGFSGPTLWLGGGMDQDFYNYYILASWLSGCIPSTPDPVPLQRPRSYRELRDLMMRFRTDKALLQQYLDAIVDTTNSNMDATLPGHPVFTGRVLENPLTCNRQCIHPAHGLIRMGPCCDHLKPACVNQPIEPCPADDEPGYHPCP
jgi:hypothetical protein